jgi:excisionase family DNA binding protein
MPEPNMESSSGKIQVLTVHDVATYLRLSEAKVYRLARAGGVPAFRLGRSWRFRKDLIDAWMIRETGANLVPLMPALEE